jgi:GNAT superfamily N-acetyltransferase
MPYMQVEPGHIATIVTSLEMTQRPALPPLLGCQLQLTRRQTPRVEHYRTLFRKVGEPWLWFSRLIMADDELLAIIHHPLVKIWAVTDKAESELGMLELDFRQHGQCEIRYFGLVPELNGKGHGRWMMAAALQWAWEHAGVERVWVQTCTLDAPSALEFYRKSGFTAYRRQVEAFPDPRRTGLIPRDVAPQIPLI